MNLKKLREYADTHHQSMYTGPLWLNTFYVIGYGILFTADVAQHILSEYRRFEAAEIELISSEHADDGALVALATGIWPYNQDHPFRCCPSLPHGVRQLMCKESLTTTRLSQYGLLLYPAPGYEEAVDFCKQALSTAFLYRIRNGFDLDMQAQLYEFLISNIYPELPHINFVNYARQLPTIKER